MNFASLILKKSHNGKLTKEEIDFMVSSYLNGDTPDYQMSSMLMAIKLNGMDKEESVNYTNALLESGEQIPLNEEWVDKHSTGGVGDKTTIALMPTLAAMGVKSFKITGRGLGHTGGTADKLESLTGMNVALETEKAIKQANEVGLVVTGQTPRLTPADGKIYALRDVTATVDSIPLIAASIMSKKLASGSKYILIDMKVGAGAFMKTIEDAKELGKLMKEIGESFGRKVFILFSSMDEPLGDYVGNACEVYEAYKLVDNRVQNDFYNIVKKIATELYSESKGKSLQEAESEFNKVIENGSAKEKMIEWLVAQGANKEEIVSRKYFKPEFRYEIKSDKAGYVKLADADKIGTELIDLGAGKKTKADKLKHNAGLKFTAKNGQKVEKYHSLMTVYAEEPVSEEKLKKMSSLFTISDEPVEKTKLIIDELRW